MSPIARWWLFASALLCVAGALVHLAIPFGGTAWYWYWGAPRRLVAMAAAGQVRPVATCILIACLLGIFAGYAFSALGFVRRLPAQRLMLGVIGLGLTAHGAWLPVAAVKDPWAVGMTCGRCGSLNGFVVAMSALCLFVGVGYLLGAWYPNLTRSSRRLVASRRPHRKKVLGTGFWVKRFFIVFVVAFAIIFTARFLKGHAATGSATQAAIWSTASALAFTVARFFQARRGQHRAICKDTPEMQQNRRGGV
ncbi:MAG: hypothetical protein ABI178_08575 [Rhodanobacter sp.]